MDKKKALFHAVVTALTVCLMVLVIVGIGLLLCFVLRDDLLTAALTLVVLAVIVGISSYKYFRNENQDDTH